MRLLIIAALAAIPALSHAARAEAPLEHSCLSVGSGYQHVAAIVTQPEDCCHGRLQCSQMLSTTKVVRPAREQHT